MKFKLCLAFVMLALSVSLGADRWQVFSKPLPIHGAAPFGTDGVLLATEGGVRYRTLNGDHVFHSNDGLESSVIYGIVDRFAVSREGIVSILNENNASWRVLNRSYVMNKSSVVPGAVAIENNILSIGFEDRLAFFDAPRSRSILTIERIRGNSLAVNAISKLIAHGDTLFVQLQKGTFARKMNWADMYSDLTLVDPDSWTELDGDRIVQGLEPWDSTRVVVDGKELKDSLLFEHIEKRREQMPYDMLSYDYSRIHQVVPVEKGYYLVGPEALFFYDGKKVVDMLESSSGAGFYLSNAYELRTLPNGGVIAASTEGDMALKTGGDWVNLYSPFVGSHSTAYSSRLKLVSVLPSGHVLFHVWGVNFYGFTGWGSQITFTANAASGSCLEGFNDESTYMVALSSIPSPDGSGFITVTGSDYGYSLVYISNSGEVLCASRVGKAFLGAPLHSEIAEDGSWKIFVAARQGTDPPSGGWMDILYVPSPKSNGGELEVSRQQRVNGVSQAIVDMVYDPDQKRLWMVTPGFLAYYDEGRDTILQPNVLNGVHGVEFTSIDRDPHGGLWVGTAENGSYRVTMKRQSPDTLTAVNYTARNGMLSNDVSDVAVDKVSGKIWFAHGKGVSSLDLGVLRDASAFMKGDSIAVKAYPNPFRPKIHAAFVLDNIAEDAVVSFYNRGGSLIRSFYGNDIVGGRLEWDGTDKRGSLVTPGVYYYVIKASSRTKKGKLIIAH
ncbi:MAG: hypothetical protein MJY87_07200 [Fibrobacter sp.]|nr:hypothetical protein [Fibrobacter sp.]